MVDPSVLGLIGFFLISSALTLLGSWYFFNFISDRLATATLVGLWVVTFLLDWDFDYAFGFFGAVILLVPALFLTPLVAFELAARSLDARQAGKLVGLSLSLVVAVLSLAALFPLSLASPVASAAVRLWNMEAEYSACAQRAASGAKHCTARGITEVRLRGSTVALFLNSSGWRTESRTALVYKTPGGSRPDNGAPARSSVHLWGPWHLQVLED